MSTQVVTGVAFEWPIQQGGTIVHQAEVALYWPIQHEWHSINPPITVGSTGRVWQIQVFLTMI